MSTLTHLIDDLVSVSRTDKVDALWMKSVRLSLRHLKGLLVLCLDKKSRSM